MGSFACTGAKSRLRPASLVTFDKGHATASNGITRVLVSRMQRFFLAILSADYQPRHEETTNNEPNSKGYPIVKYLK